MPDVARIDLLPLNEMAPGSVGAIRNQVINALVAQVSRELSLPQEKLVVRNVRPVGDLAMYSGGTTAATVEQWSYEPTTGDSGAYQTVTGDQTMADQRYVALYGVRDLRRGRGIHATVAAGTAAFNIASALGLAQVVSLVRISVGGADKVIWDISAIESNTEDMVGFSPTAILIPQNASYNIAYYFTSQGVPGAVALLQLIGVVVEPRGKVVSP